MAHHTGQGLKGESSSFAEPKAAGYDWPEEG